MLSEFRKHQLAYSILLICLLVFVVAFLYVWPNKLWQHVITVLLACFYVIWGAVTHFKSAHFTWKILFEYLAVALLAASLIALVAW